MILIKKERFLKKKKRKKNTTGSLGKPKDLCSALKSLGLSNKVSSCEVSALKINNTVENYVNSLLEGFKNYYSTMVEDLVKMVSTAPNKYSIKTVFKY